MKFRRRVALAFATLAVVSLTANPVLAADPVLPAAKRATEPDRPVHLVTVRGVGYRLDPPKR